MQTSGNPIQYYLVLKTVLNVNQLLDKTLKSISWDTNVWIVKKKNIPSGILLRLFLFECGSGDWIMKPELSTAHLGIQDRDLAYEEKCNCSRIVVYLLSSEVKVGWLEKTQVPTRWIDQGKQNISIVEVPNRYLAGITEVALKNHYADKTTGVRC
jgi:hypothetical protein